ncbi:mediator of RNA polymerase II transcription subunit 11 [Tripterygium wilfordii]|uniref:Mediator of RNA polymerase II transcription subunit 11 n=1 Tax=Tripterygium wilfordii TaxID=458696 RepID=A0A7J7C433_TRIWF|nr:mediator of RNA polymerase II transcription subunit 11 [Tripterygium wilfordii]
MDELASPTGPRKEFINNDCREFMQLIKAISFILIEHNSFCYRCRNDIQVTLREEIKSACEYRPFEKCDYRSRISNEICCKKLEYVMLQLDGMKRTIDEYYQVESKGGGCLKLSVSLPNAHLRSNKANSSY